MEINVGLPFLKISFLWMLEDFLFFCLEKLKTFLGLSESKKN